MFRGTTPTINVVLPEAISMSEISALWLTMTQEGREILNKTFDAFSSEGQTLSVTLTQEETLSFEADSDVDMQLRLLMTDGRALASKIKRFRVDDILKGGVIGG